jgi:hypothetical protein
MKIVRMISAMKRNCTVASSSSMNDAKNFKREMTPAVIARSISPAVTAPGIHRAASSYITGVI